MFSKLGDIQYIRGCSVHGGFHEYMGACSVHQGISLLMWGDTMCTSEKYHEYIGGEYPEYIGGCSVHQRDVMMHVGEQPDKSFQFLLKTPMYS